MRRTLMTLLALVSVVACGDQPVAVPNEGAKILPHEARAEQMEDYVMTPAGWYHRSCVHGVPRGARVRRDRRVERPDGTTYQIPACTYPVYKERANRTRRRETRVELLPPTTNGWVEYASHQLTGNDQYRKLEAYWKVPDEPYSGGQVYYSFPGFESDSTILQPVLQYGDNGEFGGSYWSMASWRCNGECEYSDPPYTNVFAGDSLYGLITVSSCANGECEWWITIRDVTKSAWRTLIFEDVDDYYWATGGAVEVYNVTSCLQYPYNGISYTGIELYDDSWNQVTPSWNENILSVSPSCNFDVDTTSSTVDLAHYPPSPTVTISGPSTVHPDWSCYWNASTSGGMPPYSYTWSGALSGTGSSILGTVSSSQDLRVEVEDDVEDTDDAYIWITVSESAPYHPNCAEKEEEDKDRDN